MTIEPGWRSNFADGIVIPALPLTLHECGKWSQRHQRAVVRYYIASGAGGIAAGVHSTQFEIRNPEHNLLGPVLELVSDVLNQYAAPEFVRVAGVCGKTEQAFDEAKLAEELGFHAALVSLASYSEAPEPEALKHLREIANVLPIIGFYLQPAVGGRVLTYGFWRSFCEIENIIAIKIAPFNRYQTLDVIRAVIDSGREDISLYTGNDDNIICDLLTPFSFNGKIRHIAGGLLGQWGIWTRRAVEMLDELKAARSAGSLSHSWLTKNAALTDANAAVFDAANNYLGCIPGILEVLRRQGLSPSNRCLNPCEKLSPGQVEELDRICRSYPELTDDEFVSANISDWLG